MATGNRKKPSPKSRKAQGAAPAQTAPAQVFEAVRLRLEKAIPEAICELDHRNAFELLIATILSAQSTDRTVNSVTPALFAKWPTPQALARAPQEEVEEQVLRTGFYRSKAKSIRGAAQAIVEQHHGKVPRTLSALIELPGVARKTANVVLGTAFGISEGFVVDTHVMRVAFRLGLSSHTEPAKVERDLCSGFPQAHWIGLSHRVLLHGRYTCLAKNPMCAKCPLNELCPSRKAAPELDWDERAKEEATRIPKRP